jgi:type I restriction enzyme M protein
MLAEQQTEWIISNNLVNKGWCIDGDSKLKNVYFQTPPYPEQQKKLKGKKPDYILYETGTNRPIAIIEAKKIGINLEPALQQGTEYAKALDVPLVFAMNGAYCETRFVPNNKELILNGEEVRELIREKEALEFLNANSNEAWTIPQEVKISREELISQFRSLNDVLRSEGLRAGIERFSEFANILFLKLLSEDSQKSWWSSIKSQSNDDIIGYINSYVIEQIQSKYGGDVFTPISIKSSQTLRHIIDAIDPLVLSTIDTDIKGDAFEYFLEKTTSTENDLGEYFTPRNVVKTIINLVDPKFKESVYDPFCGTGGFLAEAFNYIKENNIIESEEDLKRLKHNTLYGREITTTARIAKMNMVLHGDGHSGIQQINTLENPDYVLPNGEMKKFDVIITNMPFSQTITRKTIEKGKTKTANNIAPLYYNGIAKNSGDAVCVLHCLRALKEGGRMALVVPEGFLFRNDIANVRKFLLSKARLQSVISLPQGTFLPYTGVKTDILYFTDAHKHNNQKNYWFFDAKNIGVTLDNRKRKIKGDNDLKKIESSDIKKVDNKPDLQDNMLEIGFEIIDLEKVKNNNYNLVGSSYKESKNLSPYSLLKLGDLCHIYNGHTPLRKDEIYWNNGNIFWFTLDDLENGEFIYQTKQFITETALKNTSAKLLPPNTVLLSCTATIGKVALTKVPLTTNQQINGLVIKDDYKNEMLPEFLFYSIKSLKNKLTKIASTQTTKYISVSKLSNIEIPFPSLEEQHKIVNELDSYYEMIESQKEVIKLFQSKIDGKLNSIWQSEEENEPIG